ncbi:MAG: DUF3592 domain-containing protein, partial [Planctomycetes bacterium]|nr:DUF3592 domain-containing protein [Planctomycetota bacterium]
MKKVTRLHLVLGCFVVVAAWTGWVALTWSGYKMRRFATASTAWPTTQGVITEPGRIHFSGRKGRIRLDKPSVTIRYRYQVDGVPYEGERNNSSNDLMPPDVPPAADGVL